MQRGGDRGTPSLHLGLYLCVCPIIHVLQKKKKKIPVLEGSASDPRMVGGAAAVTEARGTRSLPLAVIRPARTPKLPFPLTSPAGSV